MTTSMKRLTTKALHRSSLVPTVARSSFSTQYLQKKFEPHKYNGPSEKPSLLIQNHHIDTSIWDEAKLVDGDIFINTPAKAGTTWTQEIVAQLLYNADYKSAIGAGSIWDLSVWLALTALPKELKLQHLESQLSNPNVPRRIIKTHEPIESMPYNPKSKYIFVSRDYRDIVWSMYKHYTLFADGAYDAFNAPRDYKFKTLPKPNFEDGSFTEYDLWKMMLNEPNPDDGTPDGWPWWSQLWVVGSWWRVRNLPNVKLVHYNNLKDDLSGMMKEIAQFLEIEYDINKFDQMVENCGITAMRNKSEPLGPGAESFFKDPKQFFNQGINGRWSDILTDEDTENYRHLARRYLDDDGIYWMETGKLN